MRHNYLKGLDKTKLKRWLALFFLALSIPTAVLVQQSFSRLKWEAFHQHQVMADEIFNRINSQTFRLINTEELRPVTDYSFLNVAGIPSANFLQRSPLSQFPIKSEIPGLIGYFQVDAAGKLMTPLIPEEKEKAGTYGITPQELTARTEIQDRILQILGENHLVSNQIRKKNNQDKDASNNIALKTTNGLTVTERDNKLSTTESLDAKLETPAPSAVIEGQAAFDELRKIAPKKSQPLNKLGRLEDLEFKQSFAPPITIEKTTGKASPEAEIMQKKIRTEQIVLPESADRAKSDSDYELNEKRPQPATPAQPINKALRIHTFESAIDHFEFSQLDSGHFVLYRKVWLNGQRYIQGLLIDPDPFLQGIINTVFQETALSQMSNLLVVYQGNVLSAFSGRSTRGYLSSSQELNGELLYQARLRDPLSDLQLLFSITDLPVGSGGWVIIWLTIVLALVFSTGFYLMYRLGIGQINLVNQQQDFVSAVSHELKTPLTSIRMYGEMLQSGWVEEDKKKSYYDFILDESERLSRLINNVLQLAGLTRNARQPELKRLSVAELMDGIQSKVASQIKRAHFELNLHCDESTAQTNITVNADWFAQIMINLVDNAIKFSAKSDKKIIQLSCNRLTGNLIQFKVRDYGPGIAKDQMKKIFKLFYRSENELTRETVGTGIGLALSHQMVIGMSGKIDVVNCEPGAEFRVTFPQTFK